MYLSVCAVAFLNKNKLLATEMDFGEDPLENQGKKRSEMALFERSWMWGRTF
jgi:hypothetical protein